ncbi:hypothetical protein KY346_04110 [Candidatus Woesearchaeota archaeon]|nr:hypothetical protein [Candidatus Woesearchaeota archaeon]
MAEIVILPAILCGLIIGIYEALLLHRDVTVPTHRFGHTIQALIYAVIAVFFTMNAGFIYATFTFLQGIPLLQYPIVFQIAIGLITMIKIHGASYAIRTTTVGMSVGMRETWLHSAMVGALVVVAPYVWPFVAPVMPTWLK